MILEEDMLLQQWLIGPSDSVLVQNKKNHGAPGWRDHFPRQFNLENFHVTGTKNQPKCQYWNNYPTEGDKLFDNEFAKYEEAESRVATTSTLVLILLNAWVTLLSVNLGKLL